MKYKFTLKLLALLPAFMTKSAMAQTQFTWETNQELRSLFSQLSFPDPGNRFLYERSVKLADSSFYALNSSDTLDAATWFQLYNEMYYAAHDTSTQPLSASLLNTAYQAGPDTINLLLMDYDFYYFKPGALSSSTYLQFDTVQHLLYNINSVNPYLTSNIFAVAPSADGVATGTVTYRLDPVLLLTDANNQGLYTGGALLRIDFGDGSGWHNINTSGIQHITVTYPGAGEYIIQAGLYSNQEQIKFSQSRIFIYDPAPLPEPDTTIYLQGMTVNVFDGCADPEDEKVILYLEGFDMLDYFPSTNRDGREIYRDMILIPSVAELRNLGYSFYVVDWKNSKIDMRLNALHLLNLLEYMKGRARNRIPFVIMGESMGGVIARYTLTFMESRQYQAADFSPFFAELSDPSNAAYIQANPGVLNAGNTYRSQSQVSRMHNTRLLITIDSPHRGASIPLSVQELYRNILNLLPLGQIHETMASVLNFGLSSKAARQLLLYHINTGNGPVSAFTPDVSHNNFFSQLNQLGNYPQFCKLTALTSGSLEGKNQKNYFTGGLRQPLDKLAEADLQLNFRLLFLTFPLFYGNLSLRTNPNGTGTFFTANSGFYKYKIRLNFWGVNITGTHIPLVMASRTGTGILPYCTSAGGYWGNPLPSFPPNTSFNFSQNPLLNFLSYNLNSSNGCLSLSSSAGIPGILQLQGSFNLCTDGPHFGFVPVHSALDYGINQSVPLNHNIFADHINIKISQTPFDVIMSYPQGSDNAFHLNYHNPYIYNLTRQPASGSTSGTNSIFAYHSPAVQNEHSILRTLLSLEIGDEEIYLENFRIPYPATITAEYDIRVNQRNPYYKYPGQPNTLLNYNAAWSKQDPFQITSGTSVPYRFETHAAASPSQNPGFSQQQPNLNGMFQIINTPTPFCGINFSQQRTWPVQHEMEPAGASTGKLWPNPVKQGNPAYLSYTGSEHGPAVKFIVSDLTGRRILYKEIAPRDGEVLLSIVTSHLSTGVYLVELIQDQQHVIHKLIIN